MVQEIKIKVHVKGQPQELTYLMNWKEYKVQANWYAKLEGRPLPYPEIALVPRPEHPISGKGLLEQPNLYKGKYEKLTYKQLEDILRDIFYGRK